ncbi:hypothetical protein ACI65C_011609 [Semiaphis heraclei]
MISDEDILFHLDELIANVESEDEFIDDINFDIDHNDYNDDIEVTELEVTDLPSPDHSPIVQRKIAPVKQIVDALNEISQWEDNISSTKSNILVSAICNCDFILSIFVLSSTLSVTFPISKLLQGKDEDIFTASKYIKDIISTLKKYRSNCDEEFNSIFRESENILKTLNVEVKLPRLYGHQKYRNNITNIDKPEDYYRINLYIPLLDSILEDLNSRFINKENKNFLALMQLVPSKDIHKNVLESLSECDKLVFPTIQTIFAVICTLSISVASAERSFSTLKSRGRASREEIGFPSEWNLYLKSAVGRLTDNPLLLWNEMSSVYRNLSKIAFKYLSTVATSVPSERLFSIAGLDYESTKESSNKQ